MDNIPFSCGNASIDANLAHLMKTAATRSPESDRNELEPQTDREKLLLANVQKDLDLSAKLGQALWEANQELSSKYRTDMDSYVARVEELQQTVFESKQRIDEEKQISMKTAQDADKDIRLLEVQITEANDKAAKYQRELAMVKSELQGTKEQHTMEIERVNMVERQLADLTTKHERAIEELRQKHRLQSEDVKKGTQMTQLQDDVDELMSQLESAQEQLSNYQLSIHDLTASLERQTHETNTLQSRLDRSTNEITQREDELETIYNALDESRKTVRQLQEQLDDKASNSDRVIGGKSLLQEVDDQRKTVELKYTQLKTRHDHLSLVHDFQKQQYSRLQAQLATVMQLGGSKANIERLRTMEQVIAQRDDTILCLTAKINSIDQERLERGSREERRLRESYMVNGHADDEYVTYLFNQCKQLRVELEQAQQELKTTQLKVFSESQKSSQLTAQLFRVEQQRDKLAADIMTLQLRHTESKPNINPMGSEESNLQVNTPSRLVNKGDLASVSTNENEILEDEAQVDQRIADNIFVNQQPPLKKRTLINTSTGQTRVLTVRKETSNECNQQ